MLDIELGASCSEGPQGGERNWVLETLLDPLNRALPKAKLPSGLCRDRSRHILFLP